MRRSRTEAVAWTILCSVAFIGVYGGCNALTARRNDIGTLFFDWELSLPFLPWMILPYWSLDLFLVGSFFLSRSTQELRVLGSRIVLSIVVSGACFLIYPLTLGFPIPPVSGFLGALFDSLRSSDRPYNLCPSLHIALLCLVAPPYLKRTRGILRGLLTAWFAMIAVSTVLTYQHHVVDVAGGALLAGICVFVIPMRGTPAPQSGDLRIGGRYALGSFAALGLAFAGLPGSSLLLWPAFSLAVPATGYLGAGAGVFRKSKGRLPFAARLLVAPYRLGQQLSLRHYRRRCDAWNPVAPGVWIGRLLNDAEAEEALQRGVTAVLDLTAEFDEATPFLRARYRSLPTLDLTAPTPEQVREAVRFIDEESRRGIVYVHCKAGFSRSATVVGAWLLSTDRAATVEDAIELLRRRRPSVVLRPEARRALQDWKNATG